MGCLLSPSTDGHNPAGCWGSGLHPSSDAVGLGGDTAGTNPKAESEWGLKGNGHCPASCCSIPSPSVQPTAQGLRVKDRGAPLTKGPSLTQVLGDRFHPGHCLSVLAASHGTGRAPGVLGLQEEMKQKERIIRDVNHKAALHI